MATKTLTQNRYSNSAMHFAVRFIVASYFLAISFEIVPYEAGAAFFAHIFGAPYDVLLFEAFTFFAAYLIMSRRSVRPAALALASLVVSAAYFSNFILSNTIDPQSLWQDMILVGALMLTYVESNRSPRAGKLRLHFGKPVAPRRVAAIGGNNAMSARLAPVGRHGSLTMTSPLTLTDEHRGAQHEANSPTPEPRATPFVTQPTIDIDTDLHGPAAVRKTAPNNASGPTADSNTELPTADDVAITPLRLIKNSTPIVPFIRHQSNHADVEDDLAYS